MNETADIIVRLIAEDQQVREAFENSGKAGQEALDKIDAATQKPSEGLSALDGLVSDLKGDLGDLSNEAGGFGRVLSRVGGIGLTAAAGLGAFLLAARTAAEFGEESARQIAAIGDAADDLNLRPELYQAFSADVQRAGGDVKDLENIIGDLNETLSDAANGQGNLADELLRATPEISRQIRETTSLEDRLKLVASAYQNAGSEAQRNRILIATFGSGQIELGERLLETSNNADELISTYREMGLVIDDVLVRRAQDATDRLTEANTQIENSTKRLGAAFIDFAADSKESYAGLLGFVTNVFAPTIDDEILATEERLARVREILARDEEGGSLFRRRGLIDPDEVRDLELKLVELESIRDGISTNQPLIAPSDFDDIEKLSTEIENLVETKKALQGQEIISSRDEVLIDGLGNTIEALKGRLTDLNVKRQEELENLENSIKKLRQSAQTGAERHTEALDELRRARTAGVVATDAEFDRLKAVIDERFRDVSAIRDQAKAAREASRERTRLDRQRQRGTRILAGLNDEQAKGLGISRRVAAFQKDLIDNQDEYGLSTEQVTQAVADLRAELDGSAAAQEKLLGIYTQALDPIERFKAETAEIERLQALANIPAAQFNEIIARRKVLLDEIEKAESDAAEREQFGETLDDADERIKESLLSATELIDAKIDMERAITDALVAAGRLESTQADRYLSDLRDELERTTEATFDLEGAQDSMARTLLRGGDAWDTLRDIALQAIEDILLQQLRLANSAGSNGFGGFLSGIGSAIGNLFGGSTASVPVAHTGQETVGRNAPATRNVPMDIFRGAPRNHDGNPFVGTDEVATILQTGERIISRTDNAAIVDALMRPQAVVVGGNSEPRVTINNYTGAEVQQETRQNGDGNREIFIEIGKRLPRMVLDTLSGPDGTRVMRDRFGVRPRFNS